MNYANNDITRYTIEARDSHGNWDARHAGEPVAFDSREEAEAEIPRLAEIQESPESDYRVVAVGPPRPGSDSECTIHERGNNDITNSIITQADAYRDMTAGDALAELCPRGDAVEGIDVDQDWDNETTTITFQDGSRLVISGSDVEVAS